MDQANINSFLEKLIDWKDFEIFVSDIYKDAEAVSVQHYVTETGKSGAKRQIDVLVHQRTRLHTIKIIIECKYWRDKVSRSVIDILSASIEDLNANKGVIFTTNGFEEGAIEYAKSKNIDLFIIRDIREEEWGKPGRFIRLYLQYYSSIFGPFSLENAQFISLTGKKPDKIHINTAIQLSEVQDYPSQLNLYAKQNKMGQNLLRILIDVRNQIVKNISQKINSLFLPENGNPQIVYTYHINLDFKNFPYNNLIYEDGLINFQGVTFELKVVISQNMMEIDRAKSADVMLIVENYITNQRHLAAKRKDESNVKLSEPIVEAKKVAEENILKNGSVIKLIMEPYVITAIKSDAKIFEAVLLTINIQAEAPPLKSEIDV